MYLFICSFRNDVDIYRIMDFISRYYRIVRFWYRYIPSYGLKYLLVMYEAHRSCLCDDALQWLWMGWTDVQFVVEVSERSSS